MAHGVRLAQHIVGAQQTWLPGSPHPPALLNPHPTRVPVFPYSQALLAGGPAGPFLSLPCTPHLFSCARASIVAREDGSPLERPAASASVTLLVTLTPSFPLAIGLPLPSEPIFLHQEQRAVFFCLFFICSF